MDSEEDSSPVESSGPKLLRKIKTFTSRLPVWKHNRQSVRFSMVAAAALILLITALGLTRQLRHLIYWPMKMDWVKIPAGTFLMGSSKTDLLATEDESPRHPVFLDTYKIGKYEVTNQQYLRCIKAGVCGKPDNKKFDQRDYRRNPVTDIRWDDARLFCEWNGKHLPSEAEWEKAAGGLNGMTLPWMDGIYCWQMNYGAKCFEGITDVGSQPQDTSQYGVRDMAGNAWEWVADWYDPEYYSVSPSENPQGPSSGDVRVLRGAASWRSVGAVARMADRDYLPPDQRGYNIGFRCVSL